MKLVIKNLTGYAPLSYGWDDDVEDASCLKLEEIPAVGTANIKRLKEAAERRSFEPGVEACQILLDEGVFLGLFCSVLCTSTTLTVAAKWGDQITQLVDFGVLEGVAIGLLALTMGYFAVAKGNGLGRPILNARPLNRLQGKPKSVNLCNISRVLALLSELQKEAGQLYLIESDIRGWFNQIPIAPGLRRWFGLRVNSKFYRYTCVPQGWSWAPRIAQCLAWTAILHDAHASLGIPEVIRMVNPPEFIRLKDREGRTLGLIFLLYDNILIATINKPLQTAWAQRLQRNCNYFGILLKHLRIFSPTDLALESRSQLLEAPVYLGAELATANGRLIWRHPPKKIEKWIKIRSQLSTEKSRPVDVARCIGVVVWDRTLSLQPLSGIAPTIRILSRVASHVGSFYRRWLFSTIELSDAELATLTSELEMIKLNRWRQTPWFETSKTARIATDANLERLAAVELEDGAVSAVEVQVVDRSLDIFFREFEAVELGVDLAITRHGNNTRIVIACDNTAVVHVLARGYSSTELGNIILGRIQQKITDKSCRLEVIGIRGVDNVADCPTRDNPICTARLAATWQVLTATDEGTSRNIPSIADSTQDGVYQHHFDESDKESSSVVEHSILSILADADWRTSEIVAEEGRRKRP